MSDNEADPSSCTIKGQKVFLVNKQSCKFEVFIRRLDKKHYETAQIDPRRCWKEQPREFPSQSKQNAYPTLPCNMPIDYFDHEYFNSLQPRLWHDITNTKIALLPDINLSFSGTADEKLTDQAFNSKYGAQVLMKYNLVNEAEFDKEDKFSDRVEADIEEYNDSVDMSTWQNAQLSIPWCLEH